ncbi:uncharacterized protein LOC120006699 [Tripterygium wilfordii]|uniref:uncharacterized protein LOC120006699 n=1 Tax=Tripterygium wilfordii TaxID=458696 RepID=UPI0018F8298D|nr:uncharacterized protein LOC120006699 [Tripterygium wilfordii]
MVPEKFKFPLLANLKNFELKTYGSESDSLLNFAPLIEAAPSMLRFSLEFIWIENAWLNGRRQKKAATKCPHQCLKEVELAGFVGHAIDMEFAEYLIENAIALEKIIIDPANLSWRGYELSLPDERLKEIPNIIEQVMKLQSKYSLGDKLVLHNLE